VYKCPENVVPQRRVKGRGITKKINLVPGATKRANGCYSTAALYILPALILRW
jgi:hypothetical protein